MKYDKINHSTSLVLILKLIFNIIKSSWSVVEQRNITTCIISSSASNIYIRSTCVSAYTDHYRTVNGIGIKM